MASKINYAASIEAARMNAISTAVGANAKLWLYGGTQPVGPDVGSHGQPLLASFTLGASYFAPAASLALPSVLSPVLPANATAGANGTPTWYRVGGSASVDNGVGLIDGSAGITGCDLTIGNTTNGQPVAITAWTITSANYGH